MERLRGLFALGVRDGFAGRSLADGHPELAAACSWRPRAVVEREVLVVSIDRLIPVLQSAAIGLGLSANGLGMRGRIGQRRRLE